MLLKDFTSINQVFGWQSILIYLILALFASLTSILMGYKFLQCLQQKSYISSDYFKWINKKNNVFMSRVIMLSLLSFFAFCLFNVVFAFLQNDYLSLIGLVFYAFFIFLYVRGERKIENKVPLKFTNRVIRLIITYTILSFVLFFGIILGFNVLCYYIKLDSLKLLRFSVVALLPLFMPLIIFIASILNKPLEVLRGKKYVNKAKQKLQNDNLIKIAITGSYGKTSVKNFLNVILSEKYKVVATPLSYNTPLGIAKSTELIKEDTQVFIAEMGARRVGDIKELCDIVKPSIGVLNGVIGAHLLTFGNIERVIKTKYELMQSLQENGVGVFTCDNDNTFNLYNDFNGEKILAGLTVENNPSVYAKDILVDKNGSTFTLVIDGKELECNTKLLGKHNVSNLTLAVAVANKLGLSLQEIKQGIKKCEPIEHRLSLIENNGITIIDDAYNSNAEGIKYALEVLSYFKGRKIIVTPGMTELGLEQNKRNYDFGVQLASVVDYAFLVEGGSCNAIREGMVFGGGFDPEKVKVVATLTVAKDKLKDFVKDGDIVLFENDLTDY